MRTSGQISRIKETVTDPISITNFLSVDEIGYLIRLFETASQLEKTYKNTGPITLDINQHTSDPVISSVLKKIEHYIGKFELTAAFFFRAEYPHIIHNDDTFELPDTVYKAITLPLYLEDFNNLYPKLCFFDQFYFHGPAKFFKGDYNIPTYYNKQVYNYCDVDNLVDTDFIDSQQYFTHLKPQWLNGLSLHSTLDWIPGNALIFDSVRLHCASDFRNLGIKSKLGISIFTKRIA